MILSQFAALDVSLILKVSLLQAGNLLAEQILKLMDVTGVPMGISKLGFSRSDIPKLVAGTLPQERVTKLSPNPVGAEELEAIFEDAMVY
eukprot:COSAG04_NODE_7770_length_1070_cov_1.129763_2_plen_90_part_00